MGIASEGGFLKTATVTDLESDTVYSSSTGADEELVSENVAEPAELWEEIKELEAEKPKPTADLEIETPLERLVEPEITDDPVRMYLHEIGRVHLLTADDEKVLSKKMEKGKRINEIKQDWLHSFSSRSLRNLL